MGARILRPEDHRGQEPPRWPCAPSATAGWKTCDTASPKPAHDETVTSPTCNRAHGRQTADIAAPAGDDRRNGEGATRARLPSPAHTPGRYRRIPSDSACYFFRPNFFSSFARVSGPPRRAHRSTGRCRASRRPAPGCRWRCRRTAAHPRPQHPADLGEHRGLVRARVDDPVGDYHVGPGVLYRQSYGQALADLHLLQTELADGAACLGQHLRGHVYPDDLPGRTHQRHRALGLDDAQGLAAAVLLRQVLTAS